MLSLSSLLAGGVSGTILVACGSAPPMDRCREPTCLEPERSVFYAKAREPIAHAMFGNSVAVDARGTVAAIGAMREADGAGAVYLYSRRDRSWQLDARFAPDGEHFGKTVALSSSGDLLVVAGNASDNTGFVQLVERTRTSWRATHRLVPAGNTIDDSFGVGLAVSGDGTFVAVGQNGGVFMFARSGDTWRQLDLAMPEEAMRQEVGVALAFDHSGRWLAVGARDANKRAGSVYVFGRTEAWRYRMTLAARVPIAGHRFGSSVAFSHDGATLAIGAPGRDVLEISESHLDLEKPGGRLYVFARSGAGWHQQAELMSPTSDASNKFGWSVALSKDGRALAIGAPGERGRDEVFAGGAGVRWGSTGAIYAFVHSDTRWIQCMNIVAPNSGRGQRFGDAVAIDSTGDTIIVGAWGEANSSAALPTASPNQSTAGDDQRSAPDAGAAYIYRWTAPPRRSPRGQESVMTTWCGKVTSRSFADGRPSM